MCGSFLTPYSLRQVSRIQFFSVGPRRINQTTRIQNADAAYYTAAHAARVLVDAMCAAEEACTYFSQPAGVPLVYRWSHPTMSLYCATPPTLPVHTARLASTLDPRRRPAFTAPQTRVDMYQMLLELDVAPYSTRRAKVAFVRRLVDGDARAEQIACFARGARSPQPPLAMPRHGQPRHATS